ncbi:hypothetical protein CEXT_129781 [Caerostris extrusa]|uniref:Uncharacterized protein n=1 Tax=Caerostris extrusa TaxID=172846 RepID=A0AAV4P254_CAEEX|nr:hypothetical protein CEXT_129781 [Caerostris extrusa]
MNSPFNNVRLFIKSTLKNNIDVEISDRNSQKSWWNSISNLSDWPRLKVAAEIHLVTNHDFLVRHLHRINVLGVLCCWLCILRELMDCDHLQRCPSSLVLCLIFVSVLLKQDYYYRRHWEGSRRMGP